MNPFEMILAQLTGAGASGAGKFAEPNLAPPAATPPSGGILESGNNAPHMILRRLLTGSNESPTGQAPELPPLSLLSKEQLSAAKPTPPPPASIAVGTMPSPVPDQAQAKAMFAGGAQQPTSGAMTPSGGPPAAQPPAVGSVPQFETSVQPASQGFMQMLSGLKDNPTAAALIDILNGGMRGAAMNVNNPRGMGIGAFGAGWTGAQDHVAKRDKEKSAAEAAKQKLQFDQTLAVRKDSRDERGSRRDDEKLNLSREDQTRKNEETKVKNRVAVDKLMQSRSGALSMDAKFKLQDQVTKYLDKLNKNGLMEPDQLEAAAAKKIKELEAYYGVTPALTQSGQAAPVSGAAPTATGPNGQKLILQNGQWVPAP